MNNDLLFDFTVEKPADNYIAEVVRKVTINHI